MSELKSVDVLQLHKTLEVRYRRNVFGLRKMHIFVWHDLMSTGKQSG